MRRDLLDSLPARAVALDVETHKLQPGIKAPPLVLGSIAQHDGTRVVTEVLSKDDTLAALVALLEDPARVVVSTNGVFDLLVCAVEWARRGRDVVPLIYRAYAEGRIYDVLIGEALNAIADGTLGEDPRTGGQLRDPITGETTTYYSLAICVDLNFNRKDAKVNDRFRTRFAEFDGLPLDLVPQEALDYVQDDTRNTLLVALAQCGHEDRVVRHQWREDGPAGGYVCSGCGVVDDGAVGPDCRIRRRHRNLHQMADQAATAWALHLGAAWGLDVDQEAVTSEVERVVAIRAAEAPRLIEHGFLKMKRERGAERLGESKSVVARVVAAAYGAEGACPTCAGHGKVRSPAKKAPVRRPWDPQKDGINCADCSGTGLDLSTAPDLPVTEPSGKFPSGQVRADADTLNESGDDRLGALAKYKEDAKTVTNYGPYLRRARRLMPDGTWAGIPLTLWPNVLLETDRTSYADAIQQFPRDGALRACIRARRGFVLCSCDYNQGEVITHAESCLIILGESRQARILLEGKEPHSMFGAAVLRVDYDEFFKKKKKVKAYSDARQAAKPWIFGKPGGMGVPKLVQTQRRQGPDTPCPGGPMMVDDGTGKLVPGYRGLRFCVLMDGATACGVEKAREWGKPGWERRITPTCRRCLECAERLQADYYEQFPEARPYFRYVDQVIEYGQPLTDEQCEVLGLPSGSQLDPGEMCQHVSCLIRGQVQYCDCANGYFQSMLAVAAKRAMRIAQRECCDPTIVVPTDACAGGRVSAYAGQVSPLLGSRCIVLQHDEVIAELRVERQHDAATRLSEVMVRAFQEVCPRMASVCKAPPALMPRWHKAAEPLYHSGHLVPWTPEHDGKTCQDPDCAALRNKAA